MFRRPIAAVVLGSLAAVSAGTVAAGAPLAAHRAIYDLVQDASQSSTQVDNAKGRIAFQLTGNACTGYTITLRQVTALRTGEGQETVSDLRSESFENGPSSVFRFKTQNYINEQLRENVMGQAARQAKSVQVRVSKPKAARFTLRGPMMFPTQHTRQMIAAAERGERTLSARVFDGSPDGKKIYETLTVIGNVILPGDKDRPPMSPALAGLKRYPVTISYFELGTGDRTPAYTLAFDLYENGVSGALRINYGNFALKGVLSSVEMLPQKPCKR
jgi:hypothetical protein